MNHTFKIGDKVRNILRRNKAIHEVSDISHLYVYLDGDKVASKNGWDPTSLVLVEQAELKAKYRVQLESPLGSDDLTVRDDNIRYAKKCMLDCLTRGEAPFASHLLYTQVLDDNKPSDRELGIEAGLAFTESCDAVVVYVDRGISMGMVRGIERARKAGKTIEFRSLQLNGRIG